MNMQPITLEDRVARLEPLSESHIPDLMVAAQDESIWKFTRDGALRTEAQMLEFVRQLLARQARGTDLPFTVVLQQTGCRSDRRSYRRSDRRSDRAIGMTRYLDIHPEDRGLEVGGTWYAVAWQRTAVNTECKYLLLRHAFETLGCIRVQIKTDLLNERSQRAIERLGAVREGVLRNHMILPDGRIRDSVYYSVLDSEWPAVKARLEGFLAR